MIRHIAFAAVVAAACSSGIAAPATNRVARQLLDPGYLVRPNSQKGKIAFIDTQSELSADAIRTAMKAVSESRVYNSVYERASASDDYAALKKKAAASFALILINDPSKPGTLIAPEDGWCVVNVARIGEGLKTPEAKAKFFESRCRKQIMRVYGAAAGGWYSGYKGNVSSVASIPDLDLVTKEALPVDVLDRNARYLTGLGVKPQVLVPYRRACIEGWAPAPTNDVQKFVWNKVHQMPASPIKIKPETKKVSE